MCFGGMYFKKKIENETNFFFFGKINFTIDNLFIRKFYLISNVTSAFFNELCHIF